MAVLLDLPENPPAGLRARGSALLPSCTNVKLGTRHVGIVPDHRTEFQVGARGQKCRTPDGTDLGLRW